MTHLQRLRIELAKELVNLFEIQTNEGVLITETDQVVVGTEVFIYDENGSFIPAPDGQYTTDSQIIFVESGIISNIEDVTPEETPVEETPEETPIEEPIETPDEDQMDPSFEERLNEAINSVNTLTTELNTLKDSVAELVNDVAIIKSSIESINTSMTNFSIQKPIVEVKDKRSDKGINPIFSI